MWSAIFISSLQSFPPWLLDGDRDKGNALTGKGKLQLARANADDAQAGAGLTGMGYSRVRGTSPSLVLASGALIAPISSHCSQIPLSYHLDQSRIL